MKPQEQAAPIDSVAGLDAAFAAAAKEFGVPVEVLMGVSYNETRWQSHGGEPSRNNGFGVMHLVDNAAGTTGYVQLGDNTGDTATIGFDGMKFMAQ